MDVLKAFAQAKIYDLSQLMYSGMPTFPVTQPSYYYGLHRRHDDPAGLIGGPRTSASGFLITGDHVGTHIDALSHQAVHRKLHGDIPLTAAIETPTGFTMQGVETIAPIVRPAILLDVAAWRGANLLPENHAISAEELDACSHEQGFAPEAGDVILIRTGYGALWSDPVRYLKAAGVAPSGIRWLATQQPFAVGADNVAFDAVGIVDSETGATLLGHLILLNQNGVYIVENLNLEQLSIDHCYHFLFVCLPLSIKGATGSPVRPIAVKYPVARSERLRQR